MAAARRAALGAAVAWTAGIFVACLWPGKELPHSSVPFIDKWTHFVLFGVFSVLWLFAYPSRAVRRLVVVALLAAVVGVVVEGLQMALPRLGRSGDAADAAADAVGGVLGALLFRVFAGRGTHRAS